jgi:hypothetical protein
MGGNSMNDLDEVLLGFFKVFVSPLLQHLQSLKTEYEAGQTMLVEKLCGQN